jgi:hypothetical protein
MASPVPASRTTEELMILEAFEHPHKVQDVFSVFDFPHGVRETFLALIEQGRSLYDLECEYLAIRGDDYPSVRSDSDITKGWTKTRYRAFSAGLKSLLGTPEYSALAVDYILNNLRSHRSMTQGTFDGGDKGKFEHLMTLSKEFPVANLCRDGDDKVRDAKVIDKLVYSRSDSYALLMSAIANRDSESITMLMSSQQFGRDLSHADVLGVLRAQIKAHPGRGLEAAFGHFLDKKNNAMFIASMKSLCEQETSTKADFQRAFWLGADPFVIHQQVAEAVKFSYNRNPHLTFLLEVFRESGVDLYPGLILRSEGIGAYFDSFNDGKDLAHRNEYVMAFVARRIADKQRQDLSALLIDIPLEALKAHPESEVLLKHLYLGTQDKFVLQAIEDKKFKGEMLEGALGL